MSISSEGFNGETHSTALPSDKDPVELKLVDYLEFIVKFRKTIILWMSGGFLFFVVLSLLLPNKYISTARILPPQSDTGIMGLLMNSGSMGSVAADLLGKSSPAEMYESILKSEAIKDVIIDKFDLIKLL